jgi:hypothetical protein
VADGNIRSDDWTVHGQIAGASRPSSGVTLSQKPTGSRLQDGDEIPDADQRLVLLAFLRGYRSLGRFISQVLDPTLHLLVGTKAEQRLGALSVKALSDSGEYAFESAVCWIGWHNHQNKTACFQFKLQDQTTDFKTSVYQQRNYVSAGTLITLSSTLFKCRDRTIYGAWYRILVLSNQTGNE